MTPEESKTHIEHTRQIRELRRYLRVCVSSIDSLVSLMDKEMQKPSTSQRGENIARWMNSISMTSQQVKHFALRRTKKPKL